MRGFTGWPILYFLNIQNSATLVIFIISILTVHAHRDMAKM